MVTSPPTQPTPPGQAMSPARRDRLASFYGVPLGRRPEQPTAAQFADPPARHDTSEGQRTMQAMHDMAAAAGAICDADNASGRKVYYVASHEAAGLQAMHDETVQHGARCSALNMPAACSTAFSVLFAGQRHSAADLADLQEIHDLAVGQGADCPHEGEAQMSGHQQAPDPAQPTAEGQSMTAERKARLATFAGVMPAQRENTATGSPEQPTQEGQVVTAARKSRLLELAGDEARTVSAGHHAQQSRKES